MKKLLGLFAFMVYGVMVYSQIQNTVIGENLENAVFDSGNLNELSCGALKSRCGDYENAEKVIIYLRIPKEAVTPPSRWENTTYALRTKYDCKLELSAECLAYDIIDVFFGSNDSIACYGRSDCISKNFNLCVVIDLYLKYVGLWQSIALGGEQLGKYIRNDGRIDKVSYTKENMIETLEDLFGKELIALCRYGCVIYDKDGKFME